MLIFLFFLLDQKEPKNQESPKVASSQSLAATRPFIFLQTIHRSEKAFSLNNGESGLLLWLVSIFNKTELIDFCLLTFYL
jgi:hypothetical protein